MIVTTASAMSQHSDAATAFLQDIRPRAQVFAQLLCGDRQQADAALRAAVRAFRDNGPPPGVDEAAHHWPLRLWTLLLARPELRRPGRHPCWAPSFAKLERLGLGERAAVLLRLVAGLEDVDAATVLGISPQTLRRAFQRALPRRPDGEPDLETWQAWATAIDAIRHNAIPRGAPAPVAVPAARQSDAPRWLRPTLWAALVACAIGLAGTFLLPVGRQGGPGAFVQGTPLPPADAPASTYDADTAVLTHRDFDQLMDAREDALVGDLDFYSWYAAQVASQPGADGGPLLLPDAGMPVSPATPGGPGAR